MTGVDQKKFVTDYIAGIHKSLDLLDILCIAKCIDIFWNALYAGKTIFFIGNGGSASTASHFAADIGKNTIVNPKNNKEKRFRTMALTDNIAWITALGNDISYEDIFAEQLKNFCRRGDIVMAISGSGNSANVIKAVKYANSIGAVTIGLLGFNGGKLKRLVKLPIIVPVDHYGYAEGIHSEIHHCIVEALKKLKRSEEI